VHNVQRNGFGKSPQGFRRRDSKLDQVARFGFSPALGMVPLSLTFSLISLLSGSELSWDCGGMIDVKRIPGLPGTIFDFRR
jgi:hypothetical protein